VGQSVTLLGPFSLRGKLGPFVLVRGQSVYLISRGSFTWGERYERMEGREVRVTGTLRFAHYPEATRDDVGRPFDHFYFEAESASVESSQR
jgi:hypothetical protein